VGGLCTVSSFTTALRLDVVCLMQLPASLHFEPMKLSAGGPVVLPAGSFLPETSIGVLNGASSKITKAFLAGKREQLRVVSCFVQGEYCSRASMGCAIGRMPANSRDDRACPALQYV